MKPSNTLNWIQVVSLFERKYENIKPSFRELEAVRVSRRNALVVISIKRLKKLELWYGFNLTSVISKHFTTLRIHILNCGVITPVGEVRLSVTRVTLNMGAVCSCHVVNHPLDYIVSEPTKNHDTNVHDC